MYDMPLRHAARQGMRTWIAVIVAMLVLVPTLVRATRAFEPGSAPPSIRLNRGFDAPESKARVAPPATAPVGTLVVVESLPRGASKGPQVVDTVLPQPRHDSSPHVLRGPPVLLRLS